MTSSDQTPAPAPQPVECVHSQHPETEHRDAIRPDIVLMVTCSGCGALLRSY